MLRVIKEVKPKWIIAENVQNLLNIADGEILQGIYNDLEALDYEIQTFRISAASQGAWHRRERVWIVANSNSRLRGGGGTIGEGGKKQDRGFSSAEEKQTQQHIRSKTIGCNVVFGETENVSNSENKWGKQTKWQRGENFGRRSNDRNRIENERSKVKSNEQYQENWWQIESKLRGVPDGIFYELDKDRAKRIRALGNAIVPQIITELGKAIIKAEFDYG